MIFLRWIAFHCPIAFCSAHNKTSCKESTKIWQMNKFWFLLNQIRKIWSNGKSIQRFCIGQRPKEALGFNRSFIYRFKEYKNQENLRRREFDRISNQRSIEIWDQRMKKTRYIRKPTNQIKTQMRNLVEKTLRSEDRHDLNRGHNFKQPLKIERRGEGKAGIQINLFFVQSDSTRFNTISMASIKTYWQRAGTRSR